MTATITCPRCNRVVGINSHRYTDHSTDTWSREFCPMSKQHIPITGHTPTHYYGRAVMVANLAAQVRDEDPALVWDFLTALPGDELQRLMMIALAGLDTSKRVSEIWDWITELPAARTAA